jgi:hypothetical protein
VNTSQRSSIPNDIPHEAPSPPARTSTALATSPVGGEGVHALAELIRERHRGGEGTSRLGADRPVGHDGACEHGVGRAGSLLWAESGAAAGGHLLDRREQHHQDERRAEHPSGHRRVDAR